MARMVLTSSCFVDGRIELTEEDLPLTIGRSHRADITIADSLLSRIHARFEPGITTAFAINDNESTNLTIVNEHDIRTADLRSGDVILLGETEIHVHVDDPNGNMHDKTTRELPLRRSPND